MPKSTNQQSQQDFYNQSNYASEKEKKMNAKQANQVSIKSYLESIGVSPSRSHKNYSLYRSPYRVDSSPSLKVSHSENLWIDFGDGNTGGTLIDLVLKIHPGFTVSEAIKEIERSTQLFFSFHQQYSISIDYSTYKIAKTGNGISTISTSKNSILNADTANTKYQKKIPCSLNIYKVQEPGNNPAISAYLNQRGIQISIAKLFCKEVYYTINDKRYFGIGNQNDRGWSIRNKYWKGCTAQGYSHYKNGYQKLNVFEGIFDLLAFIELNKNNPKKADFLVLNSLVNLKRAMPIIEAYFRVNLFFDNDQAGRNAAKVLMDLLPGSRDASSFYSPFKDLNDYYLVKVKEQLPIVKSQLLKDNCSPRVYEASHVLARPKRLLR